jgi:ABC-type dipeptide/oligopeptide/nickel transport system permease subunit
VQAGEQQAQPGVLASPADWTLPKRPSVGANIWKFIRRKPLGAFGMLIVLLMIAMTLGTPKAEFGTPHLPSRPIGFELGKPWMARYDAQTVFRGGVAGATVGGIDQWLKPSAKHWLGTDRGGHDTYSRMIFAARRSLFIGLWALTFATIVGCTIGVVSAYFRGWFDTLLQRFMDSLQAFPALLLLIMIISLFEPNLTIMAVALGFVGVTSVQRIVRGVVLSTRGEPYVEAARVLGASDLRTMVFHILPNIMAPVIVVFSIGLGSVILAEAALAFIVPENVPSDPSWGIMLSVTRDSLPPEAKGYHTVAAGGAIVAAVLGFNLAGDALRDVLDPRLRVG